MGATEPARVRRLLQVSAFFRGHGGGIEVVADELARRLPDAQWQVHWMAGDNGGESPQAAAVPHEVAPERADAPGTTGRDWPAGLEVEAVRFTDPLERRLGLPMPWWGPRALWRLWRAVGRADLVHVHDFLYQPTLAAIAFAWLRAKPYVITQHIGEIAFRSARARAVLEALNRWLGARVLARAARAVFVGAPVQHYFVQRTRFVRAPLLVPNGVDLGRFCPAEPPVSAALVAPATPAATRSGPLHLLFVGRFVEKKGLPLLVHCLDLPGTHWTFVGWGPQPPVAASNACVTLAGRLPPTAIVAHYQRADLLVLPSTGEGFPLVVQEALACGTPVLVSREVALAFPARDEACVFDVELRVDQPAAALRHALTALLADPERLRAARPAARALAAQWSWTRCVDAYRAVYRQALGD